MNLFIGERYIADKRAKIEIWMTLGKLKSLHDFCQFFLLIFLRQSSQLVRGKPREGINVTHVRQQVQRNVEVSR